MKTFTWMEMFSERSLSSVFFTSFSDILCQARKLMQLQFPSKVVLLVDRCDVYGNGNLLSHAEAIGHLQQHGQFRECHMN